MYDDIYVGTSAGMREKS